MSKDNDIYNNIFLHISGILDDQIQSYQKYIALEIIVGN